MLQTDHCPWLSLLGGQVRGEKAPGGKDLSFLPPLDLPHLPRSAPVAGAPAHAALAPLLPEPVPRAPPLPAAARPSLPHPAHARSGGKSRALAWR